MKRSKLQAFALLGILAIVGCGLTKSGVIGTGNTVSGRVLPKHSGESVDSSEVKLVRNENANRLPEDVRKSIVNSTGEFSWSEVALGTYVVYADRKGMQGARSEPFTLAQAGTDRHVDLHFANYTELRVAVETPRGDKVDSIEIGGWKRLADSTGGSWNLSVLQDSVELIRLSVRDPAGNRYSLHVRLTWGKDGVEFQILDPNPGRIILRLLRYFLESDATVAWWPFQQRSLDGTHADFSPNHLSLTGSGDVKLVKSPIDSALLLDRGEAILQTVGSVLPRKLAWQYTRKQTIQMRVSLDSLPETDLMLAGTRGGFGLSITSDGRLCAQAQKGTSPSNRWSYKVQSAPGTVAIGRGQELAVSMDADKGQMYGFVDGMAVPLSEVVLTDAGTFQEDTSSRFILAAGSSGSHRLGLVEEVRVTDALILGAGPAIQKVEPPIPAPDTTRFLRTSHTIAHWTMNLAPDSSLVDSSRNGIPLRRTNKAVTLTVASGKLDLSGAGAGVANVGLPQPYITVLARIRIDALPTGSGLSSKTLFGFHKGIRLSVRSDGALVIERDGGNGFHRRDVTGPGIVTLGKWIEVIVSSVRKGGDAFLWMDSLPQQLYHSPLPKSESYEPALFAARAGYSGPEGGVRSGGAVDTSFVGFFVGTDSIWEGAAAHLDEIMVMDTLSIGYGWPAAENPESESLGWTDPQWRTVILSRGHGTVQDASIFYSPEIEGGGTYAGSNFGGKTFGTFSSAYDGNTSETVIIRADIPDSLNEKQIQSAWWQYAPYYWTDKSNPSLSYVCKLHRMKTGWLEGSGWAQRVTATDDGVSGNGPRFGESWKGAIRKFDGKDADAIAVSQDTVIYGGTRAARFPITSLVRQWLQTPEENFGVIFHSEAFDIPGNYLDAPTYHFSEADDPNVRPRLVIVYKP